MMGPAHLCPLGALAHVTRPHDGPQAPEELWLLTLHSLDRGNQAVA
jgi:hypothetical protein